MTSEFIFSVVFLPCRCNEGRIGRLCECSTDEVNSEDMDAYCRRENSTEICSNNGECICGQCVCKKRENTNEVYSGKYCECDNFNCDRSNGLICGGEKLLQRCLQAKLVSSLQVNSTL